MIRPASFDRFILPDAVVRVEFVQLTSCRCSSCRNSVQFPAEAAHKLHRHAVGRTNPTHTVSVDQNDTGTVGLPDNMDMDTSALPTLGTLTWVPALDRPDLLAPCTAAALEEWAARDSRVAGGVAVTEIDPSLADTAALTSTYNLPLDSSANCVLVAGKRSGEEKIAAAVVLATTRADVNYRIKTLLDVRKASFLPTDRAVAESGMEFGGITPIGLPGWRVLVDAAVVVPGALALMGSGVRRSKILMAGTLLADAPNVEVIEGLGIPLSG